MVFEENPVFCDQEWVGHDYSVERTRYYPQSNGDVYVEVVYTNGTWEGFYYERLFVENPDQVPNWSTYDWTSHVWDGFEKRYVLNSTQPNF